MTIEYRGINKEEDRDYREAVIFYDEKTEQKKADKIFDILTEKGWKLECEQEVMGVIVSDKDEYNEFLKDYKEAKKEV